MVLESELIVAAWIVMIVMLELILIKAKFVAITLTKTVRVETYLVQRIAPIETVMALESVLVV